MNIIGHAAQLAQLEQDININNIAHAYLFSGPRQVGKLTIAKWFGIKILSIGLSPTERKNIQEQCDRLIHPDFLVLDTLWVQGSQEDWDTIARFSNISQQHRSRGTKARTDAISIDDIRVIQERLCDTAVGTYRVCIIRSVERMQEVAINALLKILEEPLPGRVFILTTESASALLPTLRSRVRRLHFSRVGTKDLFSLAKSMGNDEEDFLLHLAQGAPGVLITYRETPDALRNVRLIHERARSFWKTHSLRERLKILDAISERSESSDEFLKHIGLALREIHPPTFTQAVKAYASLVASLQSNTNRPLLFQQFALVVTQGVQ